MDSPGNSDPTSGSVNLCKAALSPTSAHHELAALSFLVVGLLEEVVLPTAGMKEPKAADTWVRKEARETEGLTQVCSPEQWVNPEKAVSEQVTVYFN